ncbi:unnamed protein product [Pieris macdunnoughi]|uniref:Uncharacterized protein n=1 Tax=Pieris macdunnoughi TaxID=345717 RepID=A0A821SBA6_9NEOP|nr:unnamed protein product [Pieris macdunnoughi]
MGLPNKTREDRRSLCQGNPGALSGAVSLNLGKNYASKKEVTLYKADHVPYPPATEAPVAIHGNRDRCALLREKRRSPPRPGAPYPIAKLKTKDSVFFIVIVFDSFTLIDVAGDLTMKPKLTVVKCDLLNWPGWTE